MANVHLARRVAQWLISIGSNPLTNYRYSDVKAVEVIIGKQTFYGARYTLTELDANRNPTSSRVRYYLLGDLPSCYKARKSICFTLPNSDLEWYITGFFNHAWLTKNKYPINESTREFHPFGDFFQLGAWDVPNSKIDDGERFKYKRIAISTQSAGVRAVS